MKMDKQREAFEAWFYSQLQSGRNLPKADMWDAWQAALSQRHMVASEGAGDVDGWLQSGGLLYRLTDEYRPQNRDEINVTMAGGSRKTEDCAARASEILALIAASPAAPAALTVTDEQIKHDAEVYGFYSGLMDEWQFEGDKGLIAFARALLATPLQHGPTAPTGADAVAWKPMPPKLTPEMRQAFVEAARKYMEETGGNNPDVMYEAAFAVAPTPLQQSASDQGAEKTSDSEVFCYRCNKVRSSCEACRS